MKTRALLIVTLAVAALGVGVAQAHLTTFDLRGRVDYERTQSGDVFSGVVKSERAACEPDRTVKVKRERDNRSDPAVGEDKTNREGKWRVDEGFLKEGRYYVKVLRRDNGGEGHNHICLGGRSDKSFKVDGPPQS